MARTRYFKFIFTDKPNDIRFFSPQEALAYAKENKVGVIDNGYQAHLDSPKNRIKDGFSSGWQPQLGQRVGGRREYDRLLKDKGMIEIGKETPKGASEKETSYFTGDLAKELASYGVSDRAIDNLKED